MTVLTQAMKLLIQYRGEQHEIDLPGDAKIDQIHEQIEQSKALGILKRRQKLIYKGKILMPHHTIEQAKLCDRAKITLMISGGTTLGQAEAAKAEARRKEAAELRKQRDEKKANTESEKQARKEAAAAAGTMAARSAVWAKTGITALRDSQLTALPKEMWTSAASTRALDLTNNCLAALPSKFAQVSNLQRLSLSRNQLTEIASELAPAFQRLKALSLSHNRLTQIPAACIQQSLTILDLSSNQIQSIPSGLGALVNLRCLNLACNAVSELPPEVGRCTALVEIDVSNNSLSSLPDQMGDLQQLRELQLSHNRIQEVPGAILRECQSLQTVNVHQNPLTIEQLRESKDFKTFDVRRRAKYDKQMDMRLMASSEGFDEGADHTEFFHWKTAK